METFSEIMEIMELADKGIRQRVHTHAHALVGLKR